jgi:hypothetical protein
MTDNIKEQSHQNVHVHDPFVAHQQQLRQALASSADSLRRALQDQQKMFAQFTQGLPLHTNVPAETNPMGPITADFVGQAYRRAREMFEELERKIHEAQSASVSARSGLSGQDERTDQGIEDAYAATDLMMSQATSHLSAAMKAMLDAMDSRLSTTAPGAGPNEAATRFQTHAS